MESLVLCHGVYGDDGDNVTVTSIRSAPATAATTISTSSSTAAVTDDNKLTLSRRNVSRRRRKRHIISSSASVDANSLASTTSPTSVAANAAYGFVDFLFAPQDLYWCGPTEKNNHKTTSSSASSPSFASWFYATEVEDQRQDEEQEEEEEEEEEEPEQDTLPSLRILSSPQDAKATAATSPVATRSIHSRTFRSGSFDLDDPWSTDQRYYNTGNNLHKRHYSSSASDVSLWGDHHSLMDNDDEQDTNEHPVLRPSYKTPYRNHHQEYDEEDASNADTTVSLQPDALQDSVLNKHLLEELQSYFPLSKQGESFWLQYSMIRDGASLDILLDKIRGSEHTLLALETTEGERMGGFVGCPWKHSPDFYGNGQAFLFRVTDQLQVFKFAYQNDNIQLCQPDRLVFGGGGGGGTLPTTSEWGFGLWLEADLLRGSSSPCVTFDSPSLSAKHPDGTTFEIRNLEVWTVTPCLSMEEAQKSQAHKQAWSGNLFSRSSFGPSSWKREASPARLRLSSFRL